MKCQCCVTQKSDVVAKESALIKGNKLLLCKECASMNHEPRYFVIIAARSSRDVRTHILQKQYCGDEIPASDVLV